jgi:hypothetical protein
MEVVEEVEMLGATFCGRGEKVEILSAKPWYIVQVVLTPKEKCKISVTFELEDYPSRIPKMVIQEGPLISRGRVTSYANKVLQIAEAKDLIGE